MGFGKAFGLGLVIFIALNLVWAILIQLLGPAGLDIMGLFSDAGSIIGTLFGSVASPPTVGILGPVVAVLSMGANLIGDLIGALYFLIPALLTAIIVGRMAGKGGAFGATFLIMAIGGILMLVANMILGASLTSNVSLLYGTMNYDLMIVMVAIVNGLFYGGLAAVTAKSEGY